MKAKLAIVSAVLLTAIHAQGQVYTDPVGYITVNVPANSDRKIAIPLQQQTVWSGTVSSVSTNTITVPDSSFTAGQFAAGTHMIEVKSGTLQGRIFTITAHGTNTVTVDPVGSNNIVQQGLLAADEFVIRPYWTLDTLFPNGGDIGANSNPYAPTKMLLFYSNASTGINKSSVATHIYYDGSAGGAAGWYDANTFVASGSKVLTPDAPITIRNQSGAALSVNLPGAVPSEAVTTLVMANTVANDTIIQQPFPIDLSLQDSQLFETGAVAASSNPYQPKDVVLVYNTASTGLNPSSSAAYMYYDGSAGGSAGWYNVNTLSPVLTTDKVLKAGSQAVIRKGASGSYTATAWKAPAPY